MSLSVKDLSFSYDKDLTLVNINVVFKSGELSVIIGPNGSGKSTLVKSIMTLNKLDKGIISLSGTDIRTFSDIDRAKLVGYVSQSMSYDFDFSVYEIIEMGRYSYKKDWNIDNDRKAIEDAMNLTHTYSLKDRSITSLSGGELQRVLLARALAGKPKYLVLDEPSSNLDAKHNIDMMKLIKKLTKSLDLTTVVVLHDLNTVLHYADSVLALKCGRVFKFGTVLDVLTPSNVEEIYGLKADIISDNKGIKHLVIN